MKLGRSRNRQSIVMPAPQHPHPNPLPEGEGAKGSRLAQTSYFFLFVETDSTQLSTFKSVFDAIRSK